MKLGEISISDDHQLDLNLVEDFSDTEIRLGDFIRLKGLQVGMVFYLKNSVLGTQILLIGNGTPYEGPSTVSHDGWDWDTYNSWIVTRVLYLQPQLSGSYLTPGCVKEVESKNYWKETDQEQSTG